MISIQHEEGAAKRNTGVHKGIYLFFESISIMKILSIYNFIFILLYYETKNKLEYDENYCLPWEKCRRQKISFVINYFLFQYVILVEKMYE